MIACNNDSNMRSSKLYPRRRMEPAVTVWQFAWPHLLLEVRVLEGLDHVVAVRNELPVLPFRPLIVRREKCLVHRLGEGLVVGLHYAFVRCLQIFKCFAYLDAVCRACLLDGGG